MKSSFFLIIIKITLDYLHTLMKKKIELNERVLFMMYCVPNAD